MKDFANAVITVYKKGGAGETYNIGGAEEVPIRDLGVKIHEIAERAGECAGECRFEKIPDRSFNDMRYLINADKILGVQISTVL